MHILTKLVFSLPFFLIVVLPISNNGFFNQWKVWDEKSINLFILVPSCWGKIFMKIKVPNNRICMLHHGSIVRRSCQSVMNYESLHWTNFTEKIHSFWDWQEQADGVRMFIYFRERTTKINLVYLWIATLNRFHWKDTFFLRLSGACRWCKNKFTFANGRPWEISVYNACSESTQTDI